jgi:hypothetical protein
MNENKVEVVRRITETYFCEKVCEMSLHAVHRQILTSIRNRVCEMEWSWFYEPTKGRFTNNN